MKLKLLRFAIAALFVIGITVGVTAQTVYLHNFGTVAISGKPYTVTPTTFATGLSTSSWTTNASAFTSFAGSSGQALSLAAVNPSATYTLTFDVDAGKTLDITAFSFWRQRSGTGPANWAMTINGTSVGSGTTPTTGAAISSTSVSGFTGLTGTVTVVLTMTSGSGGTFRLDDFTLTGTVNTVSSNTITTGTVSPTTYCAGASVTVPFTSSGTFTAGNIYTAQLSSAAGSFSSPTNIGTLSSTGNSGNISATLPTNASGTGYRIRVVSSAPSTTGAEFATNITVNALPTITPSSGSYCPGNTQAVTVDQPSGSWASLSGSPTGVASMAYVSPGNYTLTASGAGSTTFTFNGPNCNNTATYTVNNPPAQPSVISGPSAPCGGSTGNVYSVTNAGGGVTYTWSVSGTGWSIPSASTTNSVTVTAGTGVGTVTAIANSGSCQSTPRTLTVTPTVPSSTSDIVVDPTYTYNNNIAYNSYQATSITNTAGNIDVLRLLVRDGGASADADAVGTTLASITFSSVGNIAFIRAAALFDDAGTLLSNSATINDGTGTIAFTGLSYAVNDNSSRALTLRVSFETAVTDNQRLTFSVTNAGVTEPAGCTLSQFGSFSTATSSTTGNNNIVVVTADRLAFTTQPASASLNTNLAAFVVSAVDVNGNVDLNASNSITLTTTGTGATISNPYTLSSGAVSVSNVQYSATQTGITITATTTGLAVSNTVTSSAFNITAIVFANGDYRSTGDGNWVSNNASPAIWQRYNGSTWATSNSPAYNTSNNVYVYHSITATGSFASSVNLKIMNGGEFTNSASSTTGSIYVYTGGTLWVAASLTNNGTFDVEDNADVVVGFAHSNPKTSIWKGTENFRPNSNLSIWDWDDATSLIDGDVSTNTYNGYTAAFGNVYIDLSGTCSMGGAWVLTNTAFGNTNITHGDMEFTSPCGYDIRFNNTTGTYTAGIGGNLILGTNWSASRTVAVSTGTSTFTLNVKGNVDVIGPGTFTVKQSPNGLATLNVDGDISVPNSGTFLLSGQYTTSSVGPRGVVNLKGNLSASATANLGNSMFSDDVAFNFIANATPHTVNVANTVGNNPSSTDQGFPFYVKNGATVQLLNNNLVLDYGSKVTVETGGAFDFNWTAANVPLLVTQLATPSGSNINAFITQQGSRLYITSPDGITNSGATGNVRTTTRTYNQVAYFNYVGKTNQTTGNGLTSAGNGKVVTANLASNTVTLTPSNDVGISNGTTIEGQGGRLEIQKGIVIGSATAEFKGSGRLVMTDGTYRMSETGLTLPQLTNYSAYLLSGGTVELNGTGAQTLSASPSSYYNVKFSGTNTGGTDVVKTNGGLVIDNNLNITNSAIFDSESHGVTGNAGLTMNNGRWRIGKVAATLPELTATAAGQSYSLTGGTVEYYNASASQSQTIRAEDGNSNMITYYNVEVNAAAANTTTGNLRLNTNENVGISNSFTVFSPASALLNQNSAIVGAGTFEVKPDATLLYGHTAGITSSGATGNVQVTGTRTFPTTASYGFIGGAATMVSGSGLPATVKNLYVNKTSGTHTITLTNNVSLTGDLDLDNGLLVLGTKDISLAAASAVTGTPSATAMVVANGTGKFIKQYNSGTSLPGFTYPVGDNTGTVEYSPATLTLASNTNAGAVGVIVTDAVHPNMGSSTNYASRYWTLSNTGLTNYSYTASYTYAASDVVGTESLYKTSRWNGSAWVAITGSAAVANTVSITVPQSQTTSPLTGDYTARLASAVSVYTWTGDISTEWNNPLNWDVTMAPNACGHNVVIPSNPPSGNYPAIDVTVSVGDIQLGDNARITLDDNLNVCGNWTGASGTPAILLGNSSVVLQGGTAQTISGRTQFNTLQLNNAAGAQVQSGSAVEIFVALELKAGNFNAGTNLVTFRSASTTQVGIINNFSSGFTGTLSGTIRAQRYYDSPAAQSFSQHYMGSPVDGPSVTQFGATGQAGPVQPLNCWIDSFASGSAYGTVYAHNEANGATCGVKVWSAVTSGPMANGKGYSVARSGAGTLTISGTANLNSSYPVNNLGNSNYSNTASYIQTPPLTSVNVTSGWHLVANPYLANLNVTTHAGNSAFDAQIQVWEATGPFAGTYRPRMTNSNAVLAPFQAFMIHKTAVGGSATYNLYASDRTLTGATFYRQANQSELRLVAENLTTGLLDETFVAFNTDATTQFDPEYDANKVQGVNTRHTIYSVVNGTDYAINTLNDVQQTSTVPVSMRPGGNASFKFTVSGISTFDATQYIYLEDKVTGQMIDLRQNPEYTFSMTTAEAFDRFVLHFTPAAQFASTDATCQAQGTINVTQPGTANWSYTVTDANSATISSGTLNQAQPVTVHAATGVYTVTLVDANNYTVARNVMVSGANAADATFNASATTVMEGDNVVFTANEQGATYTWDLGNGAIATGSGVTMNYALPGVYTVKLTVTNQSGCTATSTQLITVNEEVQTGIKDVTDGSIKLWSNSNKVYVDFSKAKLNNASVSIYNLIGQELSKDKVNGVVYVKEVTQLDAGYVLVRVENNGSIITKKLLITNK